MRHLLTLTVAASILTACATQAVTPAVPSSKADYPAFTVTAAMETPVMASEGDSTDDPAIYINPNGGGFIAATDKQSGLYIYNLDGTERDYMMMGTVNNVDLRDGFIYKGRPHVLLVLSNDEINAIETRLYDPVADRFITPENARLSTGTLSPYGICLGRSVNDTYHVGITTKAGIYEQHILSETNGRMSARKVREFSTGTKTEGCAFDDRSRHVYIAEEEGGLYRYPASPAGKDAQTVLAKVGEYGLAADFEGVTMYESGVDAGYVIVSAQGNNSYGLFALPSMEYAGRFTIGDGVVDGTSTTDGIAATSTSTAKFPKGFLVVQDDIDDTSVSEGRKKQNVKVIDWRDIEAGLAN